MKISVALDDDLMNTALKLSGLKTKRDTIEEGLRLLIQVSQQSQSKDLRGSLSSRSDLDRVKTDE